MRFSIHAGAAVLTAMLVAQACGGTTQNTAETRTTAANRSVITKEEIRSAIYTDAYQVVNRLRPQWLVKRGQYTLHGDDGDIVVYLDSTPVGGPGALQSIRVDNVVEIRFFDANAATQRWGGGHVHGAIQVVTGS